MALDQKFFKKSTAAGSGLTDQEEGLVLHLDANDVDSYDGDGSIWYDIVGHEVNIPLASDDNNNLKIHYDPSNTSSYSGSGTTLTNLAGNSLNATVVASRFDKDFDSGLKGYFDISTQSEATISIPSGHPLNGDFTLEFWYRWQGTPGSGGHRFINESTDNLQFFYYKNYGWRFYESGSAHSGYYGGSGGGIQANVWQHKVITFSGNSFKGYLDGNQIHSTTYTRPGSSMGSFNFGTTNITADKPDCDIGAIRMYDRALTAAEVGQNFRAGNNFSYSSIITSKHEATQGTLYSSNLQIHLDANGYTTGTWSDTSGNNRHATVTGAAHYNDNNSDYFDFAGSTNNPVSVSYNSILNAAARTWEFWVWFDTDAMNFFGGVWGSANNTKTVLFRMKDSNNAIRAQVYDGAGTSVEPTTANNVVNTNEWNHIVFTSDNSDNSFKIYVNGVEKYSDTLSIDMNTSSTENFIIGAGGGYSSNRLDGRVAQFRYYNAVLTSAQINTNYNATKALYQNPTALIDYRPSQYSGSGTSITNLGSLSNDAVLTGGIESTYDKELGDFFTIDGTSNSGDGIETTSNVTGVNMNSDGFSFEFWVNLASDNFSYIASFQYTTTTYNMSYRGNFDKILFFNNGSHIFTSTLELNRWYHVVGTADSTGTKVYTDGILTGSNTTAAPNHNIDSKVYFGTYHSHTVADHIHNGPIGDARFYKGALTAEQVAQNYLATKNKYPNGINFTGSNISWNANGYFSFNGSNAKFGTSGAPSALINATGFTVSAWLWRTNGVTGSNTIVGQSHDNGNSGQNWILTVHGSGTVYFHIYGTDDYAGVNNVVSYETWTHLAGVVEHDGVKRIYKNGVVQLSTASGKSADTVSYNTFVGNLGAINWHDGRIGAVKYYKKPLTADELLADFNATKGTYGL
tara:strand:- start:262 stop:2994 length:2733 start_codon:yes stop_codon:yes gene_type:complete